MRRLAPLFILWAIACSSVLYVREQCDTLYFGTMKADGSIVTEAQWQQFVTDVIAPRLEGFTTWDADGLYRTQARTVQRERTHIVQIVHADARVVADIIAAYKKQFAQESVLWLRGRAGVAFQ